MDKFTYSYPTKVYFGEGIAKEALTQELSRMGRTVMLAYGHPRYADQGQPDMGFRDGGEWDIEGGAPHGFSGASENDSDTLRGCRRTRYEKARNPVDIPCHGCYI